MATDFDYKKFGVLHVDADEVAARLFIHAFGPQFTIHLAGSAEAAWKLLQAQSQSIGLVLAEQRLPDESGVKFLARVQQLNPQIVRFLTMSPADCPIVMGEINPGLVYHFIVKPWNPGPLDEAIKHALALHAMQREHELLVLEKLVLLQSRMVYDRVVKLGILAAGLGHHFRNSLQTIQTFVDLVPDKLKDELCGSDKPRDLDFWHNHYSQVRSRLDHILELLQSIREVSSAHPQAFHDKVHLAAVFSQVFQKLAPRFKTKGITVTQAFPPLLPHLYVDKPKFLRLFESLLLEELLSLPKGCGITIVAEEKPLVAGGPTFIQVTVSDDGPVPRHKDSSHVLDPLSIRSEDPKHTGVHLLAFFFLVYHHGGTVSVQFREGPGFDFIISIPTTPLKRVAHPDEAFMTRLWKNEAWRRRLIWGLPLLLFAMVPHFLG